MRAALAHIATVFAGEGAAGNPTGVVSAGCAVDGSIAQRIACQLGLPDTVFFWPRADGEFSARFFSPVEELSVCYQALLAAAHVIGAARVRFVLRDRELDVVLDQGLRWVHTRPELVRRVGTLRMPGGLDEGVVIDAGRRRAYVRVDAGTFEGFSWAPEQALAFLSSHGLSGLCLVHEPGAETVRLRVFTSSLSGGEDVATGGAVAGLPMLLDRACLTVQQGIGTAVRRGLLRVSASEQGVRVGGSVELVLSGQLSRATS